MTKRDGESFVEYRKRVLDPVSSTFCAAKWLNSTIWLGSGTTASCHLPPAHKIPLSELAKGPEALHNTVHKKIARDQMLKGEKPKECEYCWKIEAINRDHMSDRTFKSAAFDDSDIAKVATQPGVQNVFPRTLEIAFDRFCQFACTYCNASFSTKWAQDIQRHGIYQNLQTDGGGAYRHDGAWADAFAEESNPYIKAFWEWWPRLAPELEELRVTGGEPLMSSQFWKLIHSLKEWPGLKIQFAVNSNLGVSQDKIRKLIEESQHVRHLQIYTSCESVGIQAEYIRDGLHYPHFVANVESVLSQGRLHRFHLMLTISSLALYSLPEFVDQVIAWKKRFNNPKPLFMVNILRFPSFMSPLVLPPEFRANRAAKIREICNRPELEEFERNSLLRLVDYLIETQSPHAKSSDKAKLESDFKSFFSQYDQRRSKNFAETFPDLASWFERLPQVKAPDFNRQENGDSTVGWHDVEELKIQARDLGLDYVST